MCPVDRRGAPTSWQEEAPRRCPWRREAEVGASLIRRQGWWGSGRGIAPGEHTHMHTYHIHT